MCPALSTLLSVGPTLDCVRWCRVMRELRDQGVYLPPVGFSRPVRAVRSGEVYLLYDAEFGDRLPPRFEVGPGGAVVDWHGEPARFTADDLVDTGETYSP